MENKNNNTDVAVQSVWDKIIPYAAIAVVIVGVFAGSLGMPFLSDWDDPEHIVHNSRLAFNLSNVIYWFGHDMVLVYMPFTMLSYMFDHAVWGLNPTGYRITALLLHIVAAWGVYKCFRYYQIGVVAAVMFSLMFAVHPQRIESVVWMSERKDVLCAAFYFWSVFMYLRGLSGGWKQRIPAFFLFAGALLSKPMAVSLPFVFLCIEFHYRRDFKVMYYLKRIGPFIFVAVIMTVVTLFTQEVASGAKTDMHQVFVVIHNVYWYVVTTFIPIGLLPIYPRVFFDLPQICRMALFYLAVGVVLYKSAVTAGRRKFIFDVLPLIFSWLFALAPVVGCISIGHTDYADRYSYIPSVFIWLAVALFLKKIPQSGIVPQKTGWAMFGIIMIWYVWMDQLLFNNWKSSYTVARRSVEPEFCNGIALFNYCRLAYKEGFYSEMAEGTRRLKRFEDLKRYHRLQGEIKANYLLNVGKLKYITGDKQAASMHFAALLEMIKKNAFNKILVEQRVIEDLYKYEMQLGNIKAVSLLIDNYLDNCDKYDLHNQTSQNYLGMKAVFKGDYKQGAEYFKKILDEHPDDKVAEGNYRKALKMLEAQRK